MLIRNLFALLTLMLFVACSSTDSKPLSDKTQEKVDKADAKSRLELIVELGVLIDESSLSAADKTDLMEKFKKTAKDMALAITEQNKVVSAMINNLSSKDREGMQTKVDLQKRFDQIDKENNKRRLALLKEISNSLQGKVEASKIEKINQALSQKGFIIIGN